MDAWQAPGGLAMAAAALALPVLGLLPWPARAQALAVAQPGLPAFANPTAIHKPAGYSHVVAVPAGLRTVYVAGQIGLTPQGRLAGGEGDFQAQAQQAFRNVEAALQAAGADFSHVVKLNMYLTDMKRQLPLLRAVRDAHVNTAAPPASTTVEVSGLALPQALFEVEAIAVLPAPAPR